MKNTRNELSARYVAALRIHLGRKAAGNGDRARDLGRSALAHGLVTRDLANIHQQALIAQAPRYDLADPGDSSIKRAGFFFSQALIPLEAAQRATRETNRNLKLRNEALRQHTTALAAGNRQLEREIVRRKAGEEVIRRGREQYQQLFLASQIMQQKLRRLTHQIISAQEEERKEISRELHDEVVQTLVGINVELSALGRGAAAGAHNMKEKIAHTQRLVEHSVNSVHRFARELRPAVLDDLGLIPALLAFSKNLAARKKLKIQMTAFSGVEALDGARRTVLFRVAQEALTNVARHAHATLVKLNITEVSGGVRMEISDNGRSFPVSRALLARSRKRLGLIGMKERIEMVGGKLVIESLPGQGTTVRAEIPFKAPEAKK
jgi:signal transduction histidine kinase